MSDFKKDALGQRLKDNYENRTRYQLPRRTYTIIRLDGKAFHSYTKYCKKPFDDDLMSDMDNTAVKLCDDIQGAKFAYVQSDEISILLTDFDNESSEAWFDGNIQKICSISASIATSKFNQLRLKRNAELLTSDGSFDLWDKIVSGIYKTANFDARVFTIPDPIEVENSFIWRQQDASRNSIQMLARSMYSHKECENKNTSELNEMCHKKNVNWNDLSAGKKRGRIIRKEIYHKVNEFLSETNGPDRRTITGPLIVERSRWTIDLDIPIFTQDRSYLRNLIPKMPGFINEN